MKSKYTVKMELSVGEMSALCYALGMAYRVEISADHESRLCENLCRVSSNVRREFASRISGGPFSADWSRCWQMVNGWEEKSDEWHFRLYDCGKEIAASRKEVA